MPFGSARLIWGFFCQPAMNTGSLLLLILFGPLLVAFIVWHHIRSRSLLKRWANENGFVILQTEHRNFARGPFTWNSRGQTVFHVKVRDRKGIERAGWVNCGGRCFGLLREKAEVKWEDQQ